MSRASWLSCTDAPGRAAGRFGNRASLVHYAARGGCDSKRRVGGFSKRRSWHGRCTLHSVATDPAVTTDSTFSTMTHEDRDFLTP
jgi:hypothetical protein